MSNAQTIEALVTPAAPAATPAAVPFLTAQALISSRAGANGPAAVVLFGYLLDKIGFGNRKPYPGSRAVSRSTHLSRNTVRRAECTAVELGLIRFEPEAGEKRDVILAHAMPAMTEDELIRDGAMDAHFGKASKAGPNRAIPQIEGRGAKKRQTRRNARSTRREAPPVQVDLTADIGSGPELVPTPMVPVVSTTEPAVVTNTQTTTPETPEQPIPPAPRGKRVPMADETKRLITSSVQNMNRWLCWGPDAIGKPKELLPTLKEGPLCFALPREDPTGWTKWTPQQFAGFYWHRVCKYRSERGLPLAMPPVGEIIGRVQKIMAVDGSGWGYTTHQLYDHIVKLTHYFDLIQLMTGPGIALSMSETTIDNRLCKDKLDTIRNVPDEQMAAYWQEWINRRQQQQQNQQESSDDE